MLKKQTKITGTYLGLSDLMVYNSPKNTFLMQFIYTGYKTGGNYLNNGQKIKHRVFQNIA
jgi:hypothetical protein